MRRPKELAMGKRNILVEADYKDYQKGSKKVKGQILDRLVEKTGLTRDHLRAKLREWKALTVVGADGKTTKLKPTTKRAPRAEGKRGGRPAKYRDAAFVKVLTRIWDDQQRMCGTLLKPAITGMIEYLEQDAEYGITEEIKVKLLEISAAEIDILLKPARKALEIRGISTTKAASEGLRKQVPVQTTDEEGKKEPGHFNFDTVAHCGASASGQFNKIVTGKDTYSGWNRGTLASQWSKQVGAGSLYGYF
jgi:hypothetical protein